MFHRKCCLNTNKNSRPDIFRSSNRNIFDLTMLFGYLCQPISDSGGFVKLEALHGFPDQVIDCQSDHEIGRPSYGLAITPFKVSFQCWGHMVWYGSWVGKGVHAQIKVFCGFLGVEGRTSYCPTTSHADLRCSQSLLFKGCVCFFFVFILLFFAICVSLARFPLYCCSATPNCGFTLTFILSDNGGLVREKESL